MPHLCPASPPIISLRQAAPSTIALPLISVLSKPSLPLSQLIQLVSVLSWVCLLKRLTQAPTSVSVSLFRNLGSGQGRGDTVGAALRVTSEVQRKAGGRISSRISQKTMTLRVDFPHLQLPKNLLLMVTLR